MLNVAIPAMDEPLDGSVMVDLTPPFGLPGGMGAEVGHDDNLADVLNLSDLAGIAEEVVDGFEADWESNADYREGIKRGLDLLGLKPGARIDKPFAGAFGGTHPLLLEAAVRFQANASAELLPAAGPARMQIAGDAAPDAEAKSRRKQDWLNYYLTNVDAGYYPDARQGLLLTGLYGSTFKRVYPDPLRGRPCARTLTAWDFVVAASAGSLHDAIRVTQIEKVPPAEMRRLQVAGFYADVDLADAEEDVSLLQGRPSDRTASSRPEDAPYEVLHQYLLLDMPGLEHADEAGELTGLPLPYVVTVERSTRTVLRVVRDYDETDPLFIPRRHFVHYQYHPGLDFYGWGLIHMVGQSADAATTLLRQAINANTLVSFPGGVRVKGAKTNERSDLMIGPGEFKEIDTGGLPIGNAIMPMPYRDVPASFAPLFEAVTSAGQRMGSTADMAVGDGREDALPGTVTALIEKATRIESSVIKALHGAQADELRLLADLFGKDADEKYPYMVNGQRGQAVATDFADNADIVPVSDPNAPTQTQRLTLAQGVLKLAQAAGPLMDAREAMVDMLRTLGKSDQDMARLMPPPQAALSADPVTEFQAAMSGKAITPRPDQDHAAHIAAHQTQVGMPGVMGTPVAAMLASHMNEHVGLLYRARIGQALGQPLPPAGPLPPRIEAQITQAMMQVAAQVAQSMPGAAGPQTKPDIGPVEASLKRDEMAFKQAESDRKGLEKAADLRVKLATQGAQSENEEANRQQAQRNNETDIATGIIAAMQQKDQGAQDISREVVKGSAAIMAEGQRQAGQAVQNRHTSSMQLMDALTQASEQEHERHMVSQKKDHT
jgi:hypothetical protein